MSLPKIAAVGWMENVSYVENKGEGNLKTCLALRGKAQGGKKRFRAENSKEKGKINCHRKKGGRRRIEKG